MGRLRQSPDSHADLEHIHRVSEDLFGPLQTRRYITGLRRKLEMLAEHPRMAPVFEDRPEFRVAGYQSHRILYREIEGGIEVLRIFHHAQEISRIL